VGINKKELLSNLLASKSIIVLIILSLIVIILSYNILGPSWDIIVHYLNARSYLSSRFYQNFTSININGWEIQQNTFYIEPLREAMPSIIFIPLILLFHNPIFPYIISLYVIFIISIFVFSNALKFDKILLYSVMLSPFFIYFSLLANGTELLSVSFLLMMLGSLYKKSPLSGVFLGLAALSKYPNLVFLPLLLFMENNKKTVVAYLLFILITIPWLIFNYVFYGNPIYAYTSSISFNITTSNPISIPVVPFLIGLSIPTAFLLLGLLHKKYINIKDIKDELKSTLTHNYFTKISIAFSTLAIIGYVIITLHTDYFGQIRYSYLIYLSSSLFVLIILQKEIKRTPKLLRNITILSFLILLFSFAGFYIITNETYLGSVNLNHNNSIIQNAVYQLDNLGYQNCRIESNAWVYLIYLNQSAYSPLFLNKTVSSEYPIIIFNLPDLVESSSYVWDAKQSMLVYSNHNFSILLPNGAMCVKG